MSALRNSPPGSLNIFGLKAPCSMARLPVLMMMAVRYFEICFSAGAEKNCRGRSVHESFTSTMSKVMADCCLTKSLRWISKALSASRRTHHTRSRRSRRDTGSK